eukprot:2031791-Rhodomonas_salina.1
MSSTKCWARNINYSIVSPLQQTIAPMQTHVPGVAGLHIMPACPATGRGPPSPVRTPPISPVH